MSLFTISSSANDRWSALNHEALRRNLTFSLISLKKELARNRASSNNFYPLRQLSSGSYDGTDDDGCSGALGSMMGRCCNSHRTDRVGCIRTDNYRIRNPDSHNSCIYRPDNQIQLLRPQFPLKPERQNAAREREPIRTPSMQLTEAFSL
jgi:hypothetical protein